MINVLRADLYKLFKSPIIKILFGVTTICAITMILFAYLIPQGNIDETMAGIGFLFSDVNIMSIFGSVIAGVIICGDFDNKTIHSAISGGSGRVTVIVGKAIAYFIAVAFLLIPYVIIVNVAIGIGAEYSMGNTGIGLLNMMIIESGMEFSTTLIFKQILVIVTLMLVYIAQLSLCVPVAVAIKKPVIVVAAYYIFTLVNAQLLSLSRSSETLNQVVSVTPFGADYAFVTVNTEMGDLIKAIIVSVVFIVIILGFTNVIFRKSEMK